MTHKFIRVSNRERAHIIAALRHWQQTVQYGAVPAYVRDHFIDDPALDDHEIDRLCETINYGSNPETTQPLPQRGSRADAYLHVHSLYGESVLSDIVQNLRQGMKLILRHDELKALACAAAALEFQKNAQAKASKLAIERMMTEIYDRTECVVERLHLPALEDGEAACRAITERFMEVNKNRRK